MPLDRDTPLNSLGFAKSPADTRVVVAMSGGVDSSVVAAMLAEEGYDPVFGARPLKRVIQRALQDPLAEMLLAGDIRDGATMPVSAGADGLIIGDRVSASNRKPPQDAVVH